MSGGSSQSTQLQLLKYLPDALRTEMTHRLRMIRAPKGRTLVEKGSRSTDVFFLLEGRAEVLLYSASGREVCVNDIGPGDIFGEIAVLDGEPRSASIVALSDLRIATMRASDFMTCVESSPAAGISKLAEGLPLVSNPRVVAGTIPAESGGPGTPARRPFAFSPALGRALSRGGRPRPRSRA